MTVEAIAIGIAQFLDPVISGFIGGAIPIDQSAVIPQGAPPGVQTEPMPMPVLDDYGRLNRGFNDYVNMPGRAMHVSAYGSSY